MKSKVYSTVKELIDKIDVTQNDNIEKAARLMANSFENGGILQAYGSGHSTAGAMELCSRAGGFAPTKRLREFASGEYEVIEGNGHIFMEHVDMRKEDVLVLISNSGRNPLCTEMAIEAKKRGTKIIVITSMQTTTHVSSKHSSGKNLYEFGDVVLDNCTVEGDASLSVEGLDTKICGMSAITCDIIIQEMCYRCAEMMIKDGYEPPVFKSKNIDGGEEYNLALKKKYFDRVYHL